MKKIAILQSNYIPWKGYFDIIKKRDLFIFHDDFQYTKVIGEIEIRLRLPMDLSGLLFLAGQMKKD